MSLESAYEGTLPRREPVLPPDEVAEIRRLRRHPRPHQFDFLHLQRLVDGLAEILPRFSQAGDDVLDVFCGSRPYEDLVAPGARYVGLDVSDRYGMADVVSDQFLPFPDASFDLILSTEAFYYVADPAHGVRELRRVLRSGGAVVLTLPFVWEYDDTVLEHRYTGPELRSLFEGWEAVETIENGGRAVAWATLTGALARSAERRSAARAPQALVAPAFGLVYRAINLVGAALDRLERNYDWGTRVLPMNLTLVARRAEQD